MHLLQLQDTTEAHILKRPSSVSKTPYVADIKIVEKDYNTCCHTPSLGCCGMADAGSTVITTPIKSKKCISEYRAELSIFSDTKGSIVVGINPKLAEDIAQKCLENNLLQHLKIQSFTCQKTYMNSRFDYAGIDSDGTEFVLEIKNVPQADYVDTDKKERKNYTKEINNAKFYEKIAYFPDGFRKKAKDVISPRALKHIQELEMLAKTTKIRAMLCFIIQRSDTHIFQTSHIDPIYREAVYKAWKNGVEIKTIQVQWSRDGLCTFVRNDMPILLSDTYGPHYLKKMKKLKRLNLTCHHTAQETGKV
jgi:DNA-binding sugar fermentation-stimulating protein